MQTLTAPRTTDALAARLIIARARTFELVAGLDDAALERVHSRLMSPLVWDLGHIAAFADLWLSRQPGAPLPLKPELFAVYDAAETARADRGTLPMLRPRAARGYLDATLDRALEAVRDGDPFIFGLIAEHEEQHQETILQRLQLAGLGARPALQPVASGPRTIALPATRYPIGATEGFSYDNERPAHERPLPAFAIRRAPVVNREWRDFVADGGYQDPRWWTDAGWAWRAAADVQRPQFWIDDTATAQVFSEIVALDDDTPVSHVSAHEADAFARWAGARLPTEFEWEAAAGAGVLEGAGQVWEWTSSTFTGYPGFVAHPYREYSEVFFDDGYRVLRGGSWASSPAVRRRTFRNWDRPQRRQIFAGVRLATVTEEDR